MNKEARGSANRLDLRSQAEERISKKERQVNPYSEEDTQRLLHELQVHQIELELQNDELIRSQEKIESLLKKYIELYDFAPTGYLTLDQEGIIQEVNLTGIKLFGVDRSHLIGSNIGQLLADSSRPLFDKFLDDCWKMKKRQSIEVLLNQGGIQAIKIEATVTEGDKICLASVWDISEIREAQLKLTENELRFHELFNNMSKPVAILTDKFHRHEVIFQDVNIAFERLVKLDKKAIIGKKISDVLPGLDEAFLLRCILLVKKAGQSEHKPPLFYSNGRISGWWEQDVFSIRSGEIVLVISDISEIKKTDSKIKEMQVKLNILGKITRHDMLNQFSRISGYLEMIKESVPPEDLIKIKKMENAMEILRGQIGFSKSYEELGTLDPIWQSVDKVFNKASSQIDINKIKVETNLEGLEIFADLLLEKCFYNLIENSVMHGGAVRNISLNFEFDGDGVTIIYQDDGAGIPTDMKTSLFQKGIGRNSGLGLFLTQMIFNITEIKIIETGDPGMGVKFKILVPKGCYRFEKGKNEHK